MRDGPRGFRQDFSCPALLRILLTCILVTSTGLSPSLVDLSKSFHLKYTHTSQSYNPKLAETSLVWASPFSLATTGGITFVFFSSGYLDVSVLRVSLLHNRISLRRGCPIRIFTDQRLFAPPRDFSQLITSFFASESLGIHRTPLLTFFCISTGFSLLLHFFPIMSKNFNYSAPSFLLQAFRNADISGIEPSFVAARPIICLTILLNVFASFLSTRDLQLPPIPAGWRIRESNP